MIKLTDKLPKQGKICPSYIKLVSTHICYCNMANYNLYTQENGGYISVLSRSAVLYGEFCDYSELREFLFMFADYVFCDTNTANLIKLSGVVCTVMQKKSSLPCRCFEPFMPFSTKELYEKLNFGADGDIVLPCYDEFAADFALRYRRGTAYATVCEQGCAVALNITDDGALISGVAVCEKERKKGIAKSLVLELCERLGNRTVLLCCMENNIPFYKKCGFAVADNAVYCRLTQTGNKINGK